MARDEIHIHHYFHEYHGCFQNCVGFVGLVLIFLMGFWCSGCLRGQPNPSEDSSTKQARQQPEAPQPLQNFGPPEPPPPAATANVVWDKAPSLLGQRRRITGLATISEKDGATTVTFQDGLLQLAVCRVGPEQWREHQITHPDWKGHLTGLWKVTLDGTVATSPREGAANVVEGQIVEVKKP